MSEQNTVKKLHVLVLPSWYSLDSNNFIQLQASALQKKDIDIRIMANIELSLRREPIKYLTSPFRTLCKKDGVSTLKYFFRSIPIFKRHNTSLWIKKTLSLFEEYRKHFGLPNVIHAHSVMWAGLAALRIKEKFGIPYVITEHRGRFAMSSNYARSLFSDWQLPLLQETFSQASALVSVSENLCSGIRSFTNKELPLHIISNMLDTDFFSYKARIASDKIKFITTNSFDPAKAYDILIPAFDKLCFMIPNAFLYIAGDKFESEAFQKIWQNVTHKERFIFLGKLKSSGIREALWNSDIFVIASRMESQSISTLEALSTGLPVVGSSVIPTCMLNQNTGIRVTTENIESLCQGMYTMSQNYQNYDGKQASDLVKSIASKEIISSKLIDLYVSVSK